MDRRTGQLTTTSSVSLPVRYDATAPIRAPTTNVPCTGAIPASLGSRPSLAETDETLLQMRALLDSADRRLVEMQRLQASTDKGTASTDARLAATKEQLTDLRAEIRVASRGSLVVRAR